MDRIEFLDLSEEELTIVAGGYGHTTQVNVSWNSQEANAHGRANGGSGNGNKSIDVAFAGDNAAAGGNANGNGGVVGATNSNDYTRQFNVR